MGWMGLVIIFFVKLVLCSVLPEDCSHQSMDYTDREVTFSCRPIIFQQLCRATDFFFTGQYQYSNFFFFLFFVLHDRRVLGLTFRKRFTRFCFGTVDRSMGLL